MNSNNPFIRLLIVILINLGLFHVNTYAQEALQKIKPSNSHLYQLNMKMIMSGRLVPQAIMYTVIPGDTVGKIANRFKTTIELIKISNLMTDNDIEVGEDLRIWTAPFDILIKKKENVLILKCRNEVMKVYHVSTGTNNITPVGHFTIQSRFMNPVWFNKAGPIAADDPDNPLGPRWLGFNIPKYGIHGTIHPTLIGQQVSHGCVRMRNEDVEELYNIIPIGTKVDIIDQ